MHDSHTAIYGIYPSAASAETAVAALVKSGFTNNDISALMPDSPRGLAHENAITAPGGTATGAAAGGAVGGTIGLLAGLGALAIPGVGMGLSEYEAKRYEERVADGGVLVSVHATTPALVNRAKGILKHTGAEDLSSSSTDVGVAVPAAATR